MQKDLTPYRGTGIKLCLQCPNIRFTEVFMNLESQVRPVISAQGSTEPTGQVSAPSARTGLIGAILAGIAASLCCVGPLVVLLLGIGGAWVASLSKLEPFRPLFIAITLGFLGYAFYKVYKPVSISACSVDGACAQPGAERRNKLMLWTIAVLILALLAFPYYGQWLI